MEVDLHTFMVSLALIWYLFIPRATVLMHPIVEFRLIVFRPFKGEIMSGRISSSSKHGINVRTDFFDEIFIPSTMLFEDSNFDVKENVWIWNNDGNDFYMDKNEVIRFRVEEEAFEDQLPVPPHLREEMAEVEIKPPYRLIVIYLFLSFRSLLIVLRLQRSKQGWDWFHGGLKTMRVKRSEQKQSEALFIGQNVHNSWVCVIYIHRGTWRSYIHSTQQIQSTWAEHEMPTLDNHTCIARHPKSHHHRHLQAIHPRHY